MKKKFVCTVCGYIFEGPEPPERCPQCKQPASKFRELEEEKLDFVTPALEANYVGYTQAAVDSVLTGFGGTFVSVALVFFVFTTVMAYYFYGESSIMYIFSGRSRRAEKVAIWAFRFFLLAMVVFGAVREAGVIWQLGDVGVGITAWINVIALLLLCPQAIKALREYETFVKNNPRKK